MSVPARIEEQRMLIHPATGEVLPATPENAAFMLAALRDHRDRVVEAIHECEALVVDESVRQGTKTLTLGSFQAKVTGGPETRYDPEVLRAGLVDAGCPADRVAAAIKETVEYKVDARVAKQLAAANPAYANAVDAARSVVPKAHRVTVS